MKAICAGHRRAFSLVGFPACSMGNSGIGLDMGKQDQGMREIIHKETKKTASAFNPI